MENRKTISYCTLGCKLNFAETAAVARRFAAAGYRKVAFGTPADVVIVNTCSVTAQADKKCRQALHKAAVSSPEGIVVAMGCYAQLKSQEISKIKGVRMILGAAEKTQVLERVEALIRQGMDAPSVDVSPALSPVTDPTVRFAYMPAYSLHDRTRSFLKIQDGCDYRCAYCTVPLARGGSRNASVADLVQAARTIASEGIREIVITGVNIGDFGKTTGETLLSLIRQLDQIKEIERYRISSIEPDLLTEDVIACVASSRAFVPHFHLPLQSGCDRTLARMGRRYRREVFARRVDQIRQLMPDAAIGTDVIVGFPGETEADFEETCSFVRSLDLAYLHVFPYSARPDTPAALMPDQVDAREKDRRSHVLLAYAASQKQQFYARFVGTTQSVLVESKEDHHRMSGFTANYIKVTVPYDETLTGRIVPVRLQRVLPLGVVEAALCDPMDKMG